jgi:Methyltransferase domain
MYDILLAANGYHVTSLDSDSKVLETVERSMRAFGVELELRHADAFDLREFYDQYDVAISGGLVEHWHGKKTVELISEHARCAPRLQIEVPTRYTALLDYIPEVLEDAHLYVPGEFVRQFHKAGLRVEKVYTVGGVPTRAREVLENIVPPVLFRLIQRATGYSMGIGCMAVRPSR